MALGIDLTRLQNNRSHGVMLFIRNRDKTAADCIFFAQFGLIPAELSVVTYLIDWQFWQFL